jgi:hypothetical protein
MPTQSPDHSTGNQRQPWAALTLNRLTDLLNAESAGSYRAFAILLLGISAVIVITLIAQGAPPIGNPWDVMALLDGAWRIVCGQVPHTDFHNPIGALTYLLVTFGMRIAAPSTSAISYGIALLLVLMLPWAWTLASRRLPAAVAFAFVLFLGFVLAAPRPLSAPIHETSYAMFYNREGYVFLSLLLLSLFIEARNVGRFAVSLGGLSNGLLLGLMLYCKITYFIFGIGSLLFAVALKRRSWVTLPSVLAGIALVGALFAVLMHIDPRAYMADIAVAGQSLALGKRVHLLLIDVVGNGVASYLVMLCLVIWEWTGSENPALEPIGARPPVVALCCFAIALGVDSGNAAQMGTIEDPLYVAAGIIVIELYRRHGAEQLRASHSPARLAYALSLLVLLPLVAGPIFYRDAASFSYAAVWNLMERRDFEPSRRFHSAALEDFHIPASTMHMSSYWPARDHPANINDGIDLLRRHLQPGDRVTTIAFVNPFSFALGLQPARDGPQWWDVKFSFDERHHPAAESFLGSASLVMVLRKTEPSQWDFETVDLMLRLYGDYLQSHFELLDVSDHWILYRRRV